MKTIQLNCKRCDKEFEKPRKEYDRRLKGGKSEFYCGLNCSRKENGLLRRGKKTRDDLSPFRALLKESKHGAKLRNIDYRLSLDDLFSIWEKQNGFCPYTRKKMILSGRERKHPDSASLDRIDSSRGYSLDNVEFVCVFVNLGKNRFHKEEILRFFDSIELPEINGEFIMPDSY